MAYRGYKYRLYPDSEARAYFARCFGATRYCYNYCVREYDRATAEGRQVSGFDIMALAREHMKGLAWMADVDYEIKESAPHRFDNALGKFKRGEANRPREHKKGERPTMSYTTGGVIHVDFKHDLVQLPKIGIIRARLHRTFDGDITTATVKREADGNYYISLTVKIEDEPVPKKPHTEAGTVGIDVGLRHLATLSNGDYIDLPDTQRRLARVQFLKKRLERQQPGSRRYYRTKLQIARLYHHLANVTRDTHLKTAATLCRKYDTICMETLNVQGMKRDSNTSGGNAFNAELHRAALALFVDRIRQKAADTGTHFVAIDRFEPTTKRCHVCGYTLPEITLDVKEWTCPECHTHHDRDVNAAINIRRKGIEQLQAAPEDKLPLAEGNVKPAKKATAGCDLRTGKMTVRPGRHIKSQLDRQPKAQIADGTAPPRIFHREPLPADHPFRYFKLSSLGNMVGLYSGAVKRWMEESHFIDPAPEEREITIKLLKAIKRVAADLRLLRLTDDTPAVTNAMLGKMNKVVRIDKVLLKHISLDCTFTTWRTRRKAEFEIMVINNYATVEFPNSLDAMADKYLRPLLPPAPMPKPKREVILRREKKSDTMITPIDDPQLVSYETQLLTTIHRYFIMKQCHLTYNTYDNIVGKGSIYRPQNCTRSRMLTFVVGLRNAAGVLAELDTHTEGLKERMDQLFVINERYVNLTELARRYIAEGKLNPHIHFTRAGKYTPAYYNEHYPAIMKVITYNIPILLRESADCLAKVYQIDDAECNTDIVSYI